jgi:hypothetical protein
MEVMVEKKMKQKNKGQTSTTQMFLLWYNVDQFEVKSYMNKHNHHPMDITIIGAVMGVGSLGPKEGYANQIYCIRHKL